MELRSILVMMILWVFSSEGHTQLANLYPGDVGIENDSSVVFTEFFDGQLDLIISRYDEIVNAAGMSLDEDVPPGSMGSQSLRITSSSGLNTGGHLYKSFDSGFDGTVYLRYYVKYPSESKNYFHHESVRMGGYHPPLPFPHPRAGTCGLGDSRLSVTFEPVWQNTDPPGMDTYLYWGDMRSWNADGSSCFGNVMITEGVTQYGNPPATGTYPTVVFDEWMCVEIMVKLNDPVTEYNGELAIWVDGEQVGHWGPGFPNGHWLRDKWYNNPSDPPFEGFRWRTDPNLNINWIWLLFFHSNPDAPASYIKYDHIVMANQYIGPIFNATTEVDDNSDEITEVVVFPNPSGSSFNIKVSNLDSPDSEGKISVLNLWGEKVFSSTIAIGQTTSEVDLSGLPDGVYFLIIDSGSRVLNRKIVKNSGS
nr:T9SS type A sorting domain-containing protein [Saprospiraceae bacterium]